MMDIDTTTTPLDTTNDDVSNTSLDTLKSTTTATNTTHTTTLPPRKRAKTQEEKEQRKIERILRNRRAAHASREKKRRHVEYLEVYVVKLEENLQKLSSGYQQLLDKLPTQDHISIEELGLENLFELKGQIHSNLNGSRRGGSTSRKGDQVEEDDDEEEEDLEESQEHESTSGVEAKVESHPQSPPSKKRKYSSKKEKTTTTTTTTTTTNTPPSSTRSSSITSSPVHIKIEGEEEEEGITQNNSLQPQTMNDKTFYNYLSPISIHSSASSPMDFTLNSKPDFNDFTFGEVKQETKEQESIENISHETNPLKDLPTQPSSTDVNTQESNLSLYESGQNSAVILSIEEEKQQPQHTLVEILEKENTIRSAISV